MQPWKIVVFCLVSFSAAKHRNENSRVRIHVSFGSSVTEMKESFTLSKQGRGARLEREEDKSSEAVKNQPSKPDHRLL